MSGGDDDTVRIWNATKGEQIRCLTGHTGSVNSVALSENGIVVSGSSDKTIRIWSAKTCDIIKVIETDEKN